MAKARKERLKGKQSSQRHRKATQQARKPSGLVTARSSKKRQLLPPQRPIIPFSPTDRILLIGEGDFSFALNLHTHFACQYLTATTLESPTSLAAKHPAAPTRISTLTAAGHSVLYTLDATRLGLPIPSRGGGSAIRNTAWDRIVFNFPHVGGLTKDVNRQVRANQDLLVKFFERAKPLLTAGGTVVVTVFEGEPYTLWNVRDLGRHAGLRVVRSFRFEAGLYVGYRHARTLGDVRGGGGWKGEDRRARTYIFGRVGEVARDPAEANGVEEAGLGRKRKRKLSGDTDEDEAEEEEENYKNGAEGGDIEEDEDERDENDVEEIQEPDAEESGEDGESSDGGKNG